MLILAVDIHTRKMYSSSRNIEITKMWINSSMWNLWKHLYLDQVWYHGYHARKDKEIHHELTHTA
jgi:hypothetical protein